MKKVGLLAAVAVIGGFYSSGARGALIFSDDFSYANNGELLNTWGSGTLTLTGPTNALPSGSSVALAGGLSFGPLITSGGSLALTDTQNGYYQDPTAVFRTLGAGAGTFNSNSPSSDPYYHSQIWSSYLIQPTSPVYSSPSWGATGTILGSYYSTGITVGNTPAVGDHRAELVSDPAYSPTYGGANEFVGDNDNAASPSFTISAGATYLEIGELEANGTVNQYGAPISAHEWLFTESGFAAWVASGQNQADLYTYAASSFDYVQSLANPYYGYSTTFGFLTLDSSSYINLQALNGSAEFADLRAGTTLADVTPVPEPTTFGALFTVGSTMVGLRRRRSASAL